MPAGGLAALRQTSLEPETLLNTLHVPANAGEYAAALENILRRIPAGWGRWIGCGPGWYPLLVRLDAEIALLAPDYEIHQVKEKYGTLRFYWGMPERLPACCVEAEALDPRPVDGAVSGPWVPADRTPQMQAALDAWWGRRSAHLASSEHRAALDALYAATEQPAGPTLGERIEALIDSAEQESTVTCERCGSPGELHHNHGWYQTLCDACADQLGYIRCATDNH